MKVRKEAREQELLDVVVAIDLNSIKNIDHMKGMLEIFNIMVQDYNYIGHVILFKESIYQEFNIDELKTVKFNNKVLNSINKDEISDYDKLFNVISSKDINLFRVMCMVDEIDIFPSAPNFDITWVTANENIGFPYGDVTLIK